MPIQFIYSSTIPSCCISLSCLVCSSLVVDSSWWSAAIKLVVLSMLSACVLFVVMSFTTFLVAKYTILSAKRASSSGFLQETDNYERTRLSSRNLVELWYTLAPCAWCSTRLFCNFGFMALFVSPKQPPIYDGRKHTDGSTLALFSSVCTAPLTSRTLGQDTAKTE